MNRANADPAGRPRRLVVLRALGRCPLAVSCPPLSSSWLFAPSRTVAATAVFWTPPSRSIRTQQLPLCPRTHTLCDYGTCKTSFNIAIPTGGFAGSKNASSAFGFLSSLYQQPASWRLERIRPSVGMSRSRSGGDLRFHQDQFCRSSCRSSLSQ